MKKTTGKGISYLTMSLILTACGGGGGGGGTIPNTTFTSVDALSANSTVVASAISQEVNWTGDPATETVTSIGPVSAVSTTSTYAVTIDANGIGTKYVISTPTSTVTFDKAAGDIFVEVAPGIGGAMNAAGTAAALLASSTYFGWNYQGYGVWETNSGTGSGTEGVMSMGAVTAGSAIPATGSATFTGNMGGIYLSPTGYSSLAMADLTVNANFSARNLAFSTTGTHTTTDMSTFTANPGLNLTGTLSYAAGTSSFTGQLTSASGTLSGSSTGQFYGPAAQELGGVFFVEAASGLETYGGAYGAKR